VKKSLVGHGCLRVNGRRRRSSGRRRRHQKSFFKLVEINSLREEKRREEHDGYDGGLRGERESSLRGTLAASAGIILQNRASEKTPIGGNRGRRRRKRPMRPWFET
jgi:hypothetical protein